MWSHLEELRKRILRIFLVLLVLAILFFWQLPAYFDLIFFAPKDKDFWTYQVLNHFLSWLNFTPIHFEALEFSVQNVEVTGQFSTHLMLSFWGALIFSCPYIFWEIWAFIKPALYPNEQKASRYLIFYSWILIFVGLFFGYFILTPLSLQFFANYQLSSSIQNQIYLSSYLQLVTQTTFYSALLFQFPILILLLYKMGLIDADFLKHYRKHAIVFILIFAAILTPPDFITQIIVGFPLYLLYEWSIFLTRKKVKNY